MFRVYRMPEPGEFFLLGGDTAQGGTDSNFGGCLSYDQLDFPIVWDFPNTVAAAVTPQLHLLLEWLFKVTGVRPMIGLERQNGGASEMERLRVLNRKDNYRLYVAKKFGLKDGEEETEKLGWDTNNLTRPKLVGDYQEAFNGRVYRIYDSKMVLEAKTFVTNKSGKPEASRGNHDDAVIGPAICHQMYQTERPDPGREPPPRPRPRRRRNYMVNGRGR